MMIMTTEITIAKMKMMMMMMKTTTTTTPKTTSIINYIIHYTMYYQLNERNQYE